MPPETRNCSLYAATRPVHSSAPTQCDVHLPPSLLVAHTPAPPQNAAKHTVYLAVPMRSGALYRRSCLAPIPNSPIPKSDEAPSSRLRPREAVRIYRCSCLAPNQRRPPNAAKRFVYLAATTRICALCRRTCLVPSLRRLPKGAPLLSGRWYAHEVAPICHYPC